MSVEMSETRSIVIRAKVSEIGNDRIVIHPNDDPDQSMTVATGDVLAFGDKTEKAPKAA
jgi:hypothetical protein